MGRHKRSGFYHQGYAGLPQLQCKVIWCAVGYLARSSREPMPIFILFGKRLPQRLGSFWWHGKPVNNSGVGTVVVVAALAATLFSPSF